MHVTRWLVTCMLAFLIAGPVHAGEAMWTKEFNKDIKYKKLTAAGIYLVLTDEGMFGLDPKNGNELWSVVGEKLKPDDIEYIEGSPLLLIAKTKGFTSKSINMSAVNIMDGKEMWSVEGIEGILVGTEAVPEHGLVLMFSMGGKDGIAINAYDIYDGSHKYKVAFPAKEEMKKVTLMKPEGAGTFSTKLKIVGHQQPLVDGDHLIMYYDYLRKIDLKTGQQVWMDQEKGRAKEHKKRPKPENAPLPRSNFAQMVLKDGTLYTPYDKGFAAVNASNGQIKWLVEKLKGDRATAIQFLDDGNLMVRSGGFMSGSGKKAKLVNPVYNMISMANGTPAWKKPYELKGGGTNIQLAGAEIYVVGTDERLHVINKTDGKELAKRKIKFKDSPHTITHRPEGLLIQGGQTVALYDISGNGDPKEKWSQYYKAPGRFGMFSKMILGAVSMMSYMDASARASNSYSGSASNSIANEQRQNAFNTFNRAMGERVTATSSSDRYQYVLTDLDDGVGLMGINLKTGAADREVLLKDKEPDYDIDEMGGVLFYQKGDKDLTCFKLD